MTTKTLPQTGGSFVRDGNTLTQVQAPTAPPAPVATTLPKPTPVIPMPKPTPVMPMPKPLSETATPKTK